MKKSILFYICILMVCFALWSCQAVAVSLVWDANTEGDLAGYRVYRGTVSGTYSLVEDVGDQTAYNDIVSDGGYYWVITAYDTSGNESDYSNEVNKIVDTIPPLAPGTLRFGTP